MKRYVFKNIAEWVVTNEKGQQSEQLFTGLKVYTGSTEASAVYFQRPFFCKINDRYLFIQQHPNKRNDALTIPLNQIAHSNDELKAILLGNTDVTAQLEVLTTGVANNLATNVDLQQRMVFEEQASVKSADAINFVHNAERNIGTYTRDGGSTTPLYRYDYVITDFSVDFNTGYKKPNDTITVIDLHINAILQDINGNNSVQNFAHNTAGNGTTRDYWDDAGGANNAILKIGLSDIKAEGIFTHGLFSMYFIKSNTL